jgi:Flp pilus assembly pilin Flp
MKAPALSIRDEAGQTMAEYGVVLALIAVVTVAVFTTLGDRVQSALTLVIGLLPK